ncbi:MAG: response regulator [Oleiphilaceae bacterium]|nr:response regulator [Oleiphilaceae bacterium]
MMMPDIAEHKNKISLALMLGLLLLLHPLSLSAGSAQQPASIDLRQSSWGEGQHHELDGQWRLAWGEWLSPHTMVHGENIRTFPVPAQWDKPGQEQLPLPRVGFASYQTRVLVPADVGELYLYMSDIPSAYRLYANGELLGGNGQPAESAAQEEPGFTPRVFSIPQHQGELLLTLHLSNFHYREGGIWFSPRLTDESGYFSLAKSPVIYAVFFAAVLISLGIYNLSLYLFRRTELAAGFFGLLCMAVGLRRLLIDERVLYDYGWLSWEALQTIEHLCFYLSLPLFVSYFAALFAERVNIMATRLAWAACGVFSAVSLFYPTRVFTEFNVVFQGLVSLAVVYCVWLYLRVWHDKGKAAWDFGLSLAILAIAVIHDVLKANDFFDTPNVAHFGVLAFAIAQSLSLQRRYLNSMRLVESMSASLQERNEELMQLDAFKDEFLATTSHELRTPLHGIAGLAKNLNDTSAKQLSAPQQEQLRLIQSTAQRLGTLVNDILDFSSAKHGRLQLHPTRIDLEEVCDWLMVTLKPLLGSKPVTVTRYIDPNCRYIKADLYRMQQILCNLVGNAIKFTEEGSVRLLVDSRDGSLLITIEDTGVGMSPEQIERLFTAYEQVHEQSQYRAGGSGLGLSIARHLVHLHGGELKVESSEGKGSRVMVSLPHELVLRDAEQALPLEQHAEAKALITEESATPKARVEEPLSQGVCVYIVDDEAVNRELIKGQLAGFGYHIKTFESGFDLLKAMQQRVPDVILLDLMMPGMNGFEVCQSVRRDFNSYELPIIMLTARHQVQDIVQSLSVGANDYLIKPYNEQELIARVSSQISVRESWIANRENQRLKSEIDRRKQLERELSVLNAQLLQVLDVSDELIMLVNTDLEPVYMNGVAKEEFSEIMQSLQGDQGLDINDLLNEDLAAEIQACLNDAEALPRWLTSSGVQPGDLWQCSIRVFEEDRQRYAALLVRKSQSVQETDPASALASLTRELSENRRKINQIEGALRQIRFRPIIEQNQNGELIAATKVSKGGVASEEVKARIVALHRLTLNLWERYAKQGKAELAERSRCWRVYIDGTTVKTRTFDKYLSTKTVPDKPRWRSVVRTANFVLAQCQLSESDRAELMQLTETVEESFS